LGASRDRCIPDLGFEGQDLVLLLRRKKLRSIPPREIMWAAIQIDPRADIVFELHLKVARNVTFEQTETIIGRADCVCLLKN